VVIIFEVKKWCEENVALFLYFSMFWVFYVVTFSVRDGISGRGVSGDSTSLRVEFFSDIWFVELLPNNARN
jgi:hypothetical protein